MSNMNDPPEIKSDRTLRQELGVQRWVDSKCASTLCYATGVGKSNTAVIAINRFLAKNPQGRITIIVPTENLKTQWLTNLGKQGIVFNVSVLIINSAVLRPFETDLLIIDEVHSIVTATFFKLFEVCKYKMVLGLTATFERLDGKHDLLNKYCPIVDTITLKEATANGWLSEYKEYKVMIDVDNIEEYQLANAEFMNHFAFFDFKFDVAMG